nr:hypothetical protein CFP56_56415 [Quercus suber]
MQFTNAIGFRGKFYALTLQGTLAVIEEDDSHLKITSLGTKRAIPSVSTRHFREYLVESNGVILLIFLISKKSFNVVDGVEGTLAVIEEDDSHLKITSLGTKRAIPSVSTRHFREYLVESNGVILLIFLISKKSFNVVDGVEVFGLDFVRLSRIKAESLGDQTVFIGYNSFLSVSASRVGCKSNCLYFHFTHNAIDDWWQYDMESGRITQGRSDTKSKTQSPVWN